MHKKRVTLKILAFLVFSDILETFIQFCLKKSALTEAGFHLRALSDVPVFLGAVFSSPFLWVGLMSVALTFVIWATVLSKIDLSVAVPIASFSYVLVPLISIIFLHEKINMMRWMGILFVLVGVICVSLSSRDGEVASV